MPDALHGQSENVVPYGLSPQWGLFWGEAGEDTWACFGLYATRQEAIDAFDRFAHRKAGRIVLSRLEETETRDA